MTAHDTRAFMALMTIAQHHGRPGTPTDQAHVESFFSHLKGDWPHLTALADPGALDAELARVRHEYNTLRLHAAIGYVTPDDEHHGRGPQIRRARAAGMARARAERISTIGGVDDRRRDPRPLAAAGCASAQPHPADQRSAAGQSRAARQGRAQRAAQRRP